MLLLALVVGGGRFIDIEDIRSRVLAAGAFGPLLLIGLKASTLIFAPIGGGVLYPIAGALFGFAKGFGYAMLGDLVGVTVSFAISRVFGRKIALYFLSRPGMRVVERALHHLETAKGLAYARIIFFWFPEAVNYGAGLTVMPFWKFLAVSVPIGVVPVAIMVLFGEVIIRLQKVSIFLALVAGAAFIGIWWIYRHASRSVEHPIE